MLPRTTSRQVLNPAHPEQPQLSQHSLTEEMFGSLYHLREPLLDSLLYLLHCGAQNWTHFSRCGLASPVLRRGDGSPPLTYQQHSTYFNPGYHSLPLSQERVAGSWLAWCPRKLQGLFL